VADDMLKKSVKTAQNATWQTQSMLLPSIDTANTHKFSSYTTLVQVTDENNQVMANSPVTITAPTRTGVYINHLYYIIDPTGIQINTDALGSITIIEWVTSLVGTKLTITGTDGVKNDLNPMDAPFKKVANMNTVAALQGATITNDDGTTRALVNSNVSNSDLQAVALSNSSLATVYNKLNSSNVILTRSTMSTISLHRPITVNGAEAILVEAADLFNWLESGVEAVVQIIEDVANDVWHFVVTIAGKVYSAVLNVVEKVVGAVEWVFNQIKTAIEDLIKFLEFLFAWQDIVITHRVMKNVFIQFAQQSIDRLSDTKADIAAVFTSMQNDVNKWANIPNFNQTPNSTTASNQSLSGSNSAPANLGVHHYQGNLKSASSSYNPASITEAVFEDLLNLLNSEEATLSAAFNAIKTDIIDQFDTLSVTEIIQKFIAIVVDTLLQTAENIILAVVDVFIQLAQGVISLMTMKLDIPIISWLYNEITGDDLSFLDLVCLIAAIPATIVYKIATGSAPFPKGDAFTNDLINATSFSQIQSLFYTSAPSLGSNARGIMLTTSAETPVLDETKLKIFGVVTGFFAFAGSIVLILTVTVQRTLEIFDVNLKSLALINAIANVAYVSPNIATFINVKTGNWYGQMNNTLTGISIIKGFVNIPLTLVPSDSPWSKVSPAVESVINLIWNIPVIMNIKANKDRWNTDYKSLIPESIGNFAFNVGGMMELLIAKTEDLETKAIESSVQFGLMGVYGICMPIAGGI
jgi:hypothetical protein